MYKLSDIAERVEMSTEATMRLLNEMRESDELQSSFDGDIITFVEQEKENEEKLFLEMEALEKRTQCLKDSIAQLDRKWV